MARNTDRRSLRAAVPGGLAPRAVSEATLSGQASGGDSSVLENEALSGSVAFPRRRLVFFICAMALFMSSINGSTVSTALPRIGAALGSPINWTGWTITIYQLGQVIAAPIAGRISDQFGRKKVFLACVSIFTLSSCACGLASSIYMLLVLRFIQALGGGTFVACTSGIVADHFGLARDRAIGMFTSITPIGYVIGPIFGGLIAQYWSWRGIFFVNVPVGIVLVGLVIRFIPRAVPRKASRFDLPGVLLLACLIISAMIAIAMLGEHDTALDNPRVLVPAVLALSLGVAFRRHELNTEEPFIPMQLLAGKGFASMNALNTIYGTTSLGFATIIPLYAETRYHISVSSAGTVLSARGVGTICVAAAAAMMLRRTGYRLPMVIGFCSIALSLIMFSVTPHVLPTYWWLAVAAMLTGLGIGIAAPATNNATLQRAPDQVAALVGLRSMFRQSGGILYISIATAVLARSSDPGVTQAHLFLIQAALVIAAMSVIFTVPDHKGGW